MELQVISDGLNSKISEAVVTPVVTRVSERVTTTDNDSNGAGIIIMDVTVGMIILQQRLEIE